MLRTVIECTQRGRGAEGVEGGAFRDGRQRLSTTLNSVVQAERVRGAAVTPTAGPDGRVSPRVVATGDRADRNQGEDGTMMNTYARTPSMVGAPGRAA
jgi:hypothetical protein